MTIENEQLLAYVFWHTPAENVGRDDYEESLRRFHATLDVRSWSFRIPVFPFPGGGGYEDWYLVHGWHEIGVLNAAAVDVSRAETHDAIAARSAHGWGGIYRLFGGTPEPPAAARWLSKPDREDSSSFVARLEAASVWQRQLTLGPAPEYCVSDHQAGKREQIV